MSVQPPFRRVALLPSSCFRACRDRPKGGGSGGWAKRSSCPALSGSIVSLEGAVCDSGCPSPSGTVGAIAEDGQLRARCCAKATQHAAQLPSLSIGLDWYIAEDHLLAIIIAGLRNEHLEAPYLIAAHRTHVTGIDGQRDRVRVCWRWQRRWRRDSRALQPGADLQCPTLNGVDLSRFPHRASCTPERKAPHLSGGLMLQKWAVRSGPFVGPRHFA